LPWQLNKSFSDVRSARSTQVQIEVRFLVFVDEKS
jgi:hypothetical protein